MSFLNYFVSKSFSASNRLVGMFAPEKARLRGIKRVMEHYDMVKEENEKFFSLLYMYFIEQRVGKVFNDRKITMLDAGCGQGRIAIPLAKKGHQVKGIDLSQKAIDLAREYAISEQVKIEFSAGNISKEIKKLKTESFDCIICTEVLYMLKDHEAIVRDLAGLLKKGGILFLSLRPKWFYVLYLIINNDIEQARDLALNNNCRDINNEKLNCQSRSEMIDMLKSNKLKDIETRGIGVLSGINGDPQARFIMPAQLDKKYWELLLQMEEKLGEEFSENSRYVLVSGIKN